MSLTFNLAMLVMLLCVAAMYFIQIRLKEQDTGAAKNSLTILTCSPGTIAFIIMGTMQRNSGACL